MPMPMPCHVFLYIFHFRSAKILLSTHVNDLCSALVDIVLHHIWPSFLLLLCSLLSFLTERTHSPSEHFKYSYIWWWLYMPIAIIMYIVTGFFVGVVAVAADSLTHSQMETVPYSVYVSSSSTDYEFYAYTHTNVCMWKRVAHTLAVDQLCVCITECDKSTHRLWCCSCFAVFYQAQTNKCIAMLYAELAKWANYLHSQSSM